MNAADVPFEPERVVAALNAVGVRYAIVGGLALGAHGVIRATQDLDLIPAPDAVNIERLCDALSAIGGRHPVSDERLTSTTLSAPRSIKVVTRHGEVHVLNRMPGTPPFPDVEHEVLRVELEPGVEAPVCSLAHLRAMKRSSDRPRDAVDLAELDALHGPDAAA